LKAPFFWCVLSIVALDTMASKLHTAQNLYKCPNRRCGSFCVTGNVYQVSYLKLAQSFQCIPTQLHVLTGLVSMSKAT
jgi:hypothetical protein